MLKYHSHNTAGKRETTYYHIWDLDPEDIVTVKDAKKADKGKYLDFQDGSGLYSRIMNVSPKTIRTEACVIRREDIVHISHFHGRNKAYSGIYKTEEHELIRPFRPQEKKAGYNLMKGRQIKYLTPRIKVFIMKEISKKLESKGATVDWAIDRLKELAESNRGTIGDKHKVILSILRAHGVELESIRGLDKGNGNRPLLQQFNQYNIQHDRRAQGSLPDKRELTEIIEDTEDFMKEPKVIEEAPPVMKDTEK
jgi:hypothetical protein